jgi:hypothetical protein
MSGRGILWHIFFTLRDEQRHFLKHHHGLAALFSISYGSRITFSGRRGCGVESSTVDELQAIVYQHFSWKVRPWARMCCRAPHRQRFLFRASILFFRERLQAADFLCMQLCAWLFFREASYMVQFVRCRSQRKSVVITAPMR